MNGDFAITLTQNEGMLMCGALGLAGESGEFVDLVKKFFFHQHKISEDKLIKEAGDIMWYIALVCTALNVDLETVAQINIAKLRERYPEGFTAERSINRKVEV